MVRTVRRALGITARRERVSYTPEQMTRLITEAAAQQVAARLRNLAHWHREAAHVVAPHHPEVAGWHRDEALGLDAIADQEVRR